MKRLKCILSVPKEKYTVANVIVGNIYEQIEGYDDSNDYFLKDESGRYIYYDKKYFEEVSMKEHFEVRGLKITSPDIDGDFAIRLEDSGMFDFIDEQEAKELIKFLQKYFKNKE